MSDDGLLSDPGAMAADYSGALPQDYESSQLPDLENLSPTFPTLSLPASTMDTSSDQGDSIFTGIPSVSSGLDLSGLFGVLSSDLNQGFQAFVINPQNAATNEGVANNNAQNSLMASSNLFSYLLIGLGLFLVFGFLTRKS